SGLQNDIWIWQTLPDPGPDGDWLWRSLWQEREAVAVAPAAGGGAVALLGVGVSLDVAPMVSPSVLRSLGAGGLHWTSAVEPGRAMNDSSVLPIAIAAASDGASILDTMYSTSRGPILGSEAGTPRIARQAA